MAYCVAEWWNRNFVADVAFVIVMDTAKRNLNATGICMRGMALGRMLRQVGNFGNGYPLPSEKNTSPQMSRLVLSS